MPSLLLVTGSRSLCETHGGTCQSFEWFREELRKRIVLSEHPPNLVLNGRADGPDAVSTTLAMAVRPRIAVREFRLCGWIYRSDSTGDALSRGQRWRDADGPAVSPLERNRVMVAHCAWARDNMRWQVRVLGLVAPWSRTHGSDHTLGLAKRAELDVTRLECPVAYGRATDAVR
jgi:hypothetical protein